MKFFLSKPFLRLHVLILAFIMALGLWLRFDGLDWGLPFRLHPDEWKYVSGGAGVHFGEWNPRYFRNPPGFSYLNAAWQPIWLRVTPDVEVPEWLGVEPASIAPSTDVRVTFYRRPFDLTHGARALSAIFGTLTIFFTYLLARQFVSKGGALAAAGLAAVSFVGVRESHFATNDAAAACAALAAVWAGAAAFRREKRWGFYAAAALGGVATAIKYNMFPAALAVLGCRATLGWKRRTCDAESPTRIALDLIGISAICVVAFLTICPWPILDPPTFWGEIDKLSEAASKHWPGQDTRLSGIQLAESVWLSEGVISCLLAAVGAAALLRARCWALFFFPALYALLVMAHPLYFVRFALPILPFIAICAARGIERIADWPQCSATRREWVLAGCACLCMIQPLAMDLRSNWLFKQEDVRVSTLRWLLKETSQERFFVVGGQFSQPIPYRTEQPPWGLHFERRFVDIDRLPLDELADLGTLPARVGLALVSSFDAFPGHHDDPYEERRSALRDYMGGGEPVAIFHPWRGEWTPAPSHVEDTYHPVHDLWRRVRPGPGVEAFGRM